MFNKRFAVLLLTVIGISSCTNPAVYNQTMDNVSDARQKAIEARKSSETVDKAPSLVVNQGLYIDKKPISLAHDPAWLKNRIILNGDNLPFSYFTRTVLGNTGKTILIHYQLGLNAKIMTSMRYTGTVKGALDALAAKTGYVYTVNGNHVYWQAYITKNFDVGFIPGSSDYLMGKSGGGGSSGSGGGASATVTGVIDDSAASQYSNMKGSLSIWTDLEKAIAQLLSPDGKVFVSQATTTVTVRDRPTNVALVSNYIANLNKSLAKQVLIKVQVLDVTLNSDYNYGINWNIVEKAFGGSNFVLNANYGTPVSITNMSSGTAVSSSSLGGLDATSISAGGTGISVLINALTQQGRVSVVTEPRVVSLNNQVSAIRIVQQNGYLASVQSTSFANTSGSSAGNSVTSQVTPGTLVTGLTLYVLPKIMGNKIVLQINADLSNNLGFQQVSSGGPTPTTIQVPNVSQKQFNQRSIICDGDTLILAGFRQLRNQIGQQQFLDMQALGGRSSTQNYNETIILITPILLKGMV